MVLSKFARGGVIVASLLIATVLMPSGTQAAPAVKVAGTRHPQPAAIETICRGPLPPFLAGAQIYTVAHTLETDADTSLGLVRLSVLEDTAIYLALSWEGELGEENPDDAWHAEVLSPDRFARLGWVEVGEVRFLLRGFEHHRLFWKQLKKGETLALRTRRLGPPLVIVPADPASDPLAQVPNDTLRPACAEAMLKSKLQRLLRLKKFDELEALALVYRRDKPRDRDGRRLLGIFHEGITPKADTYPEWRSDSDLYRAWLTAYPQSPTAHAALAAYWRDYARHIRDTRNTASSQEAYRVGIRESLAVVAAGSRLAEQDPELYRIEAQLAGDVGYDRVRFEQVLQRSLEVDSDYEETLLDALPYYRETFPNGRGDVPTFAALAADWTKQRWGDGIYALLIVRLIDGGFTGGYAAIRINFDTDRVARGFADLRRRFPDAIAIADAEVCYAGNLGDRAACRRAMTRLDALLAGRWDASWAVENHWRSWQRADLESGEQAALVDLALRGVIIARWTDDGRRFITVDRDGNPGEYALDGKPIAVHGSPSMFLFRLSTVLPSRKAIVTADRSTIAVTRIFSGHRRELGRDDHVVATALSRDGAELAAIGNDRLIRFWQLEGAKPAAPQEWNVQPLKPAVAAYRAGTLIVGGEDGRVVLYDRATMRKTGELPPRVGPIRRLCVSPDERLLAVENGDWELTLWNLADLKPVATPKYPSAPINELSFSRDGKLLAAATGGWHFKSGRDVVVWNTADGSLHRKFVGHKDIVWSVDFSADGKQLLTASGDETLRIWNVD